MTIDKARPQRRATLVDVAHHAGVSVATASKAVRDAYGISESMRTRVLASVEELGYRPDRLARGMRGSTHTLGLMVASIANSFINLIVEGMTPVLAEAGYDLFISSATGTIPGQDAAIDALIDHQMDGLMLVGPRQASERLESIGLSVPTVVVGRHGPGVRYDTIASDDRRGSRLIVDRLAALGHRQISFISESPPIDYPTLPESARLDGYKRAMRRHGLGGEIDIIPSQWTFEGGRLAADVLLARDVLPTAVHAGADVAALGFLSRLWEVGVDVPTQISVVGYDNSPIGSLSRIGLTSVDQGGIEMGETAAELLLSRIRGRTEASNALIAPTLIDRATTGAPRAT